MTRALVVAALVLAVAAPLVASAAPDGLKRVAADTGFAHREQPASGLPYSVLGGLAGTVAVLALGTGAAAALRRRR